MKDGAVHKGFIIAEAFNPNEALNTMDLILFLELLWRRKAVVLQAVVVFWVVSAAVILLSPSVYEATSKLSLIRGGAAGLLLTKVGISSSQSTIIQDKDQFATEIETITELMTSDSVLSDVIAKLQLQSNDGNPLEPKDLRESTPIVSSLFPNPNVEIEQQGDNTRLLEIRGRATDPQLAADLANTAAATLMANLVASRRSDFQAARIFIENRIGVIRSEYLKLLDEMRSYKSENDVLDLDTEIKAAVGHTFDLFEAKEEVIRAIFEAGSKIAYFKKNLGELSVSVVTSRALNENPHIQELKTILSELNQQLTQETAEKKPHHPDVIMIQKKIDAVNRELQTEIAIMQTFSQNLEDAESQLETLQARLSALNADIKQNASTYDIFPQKQMAISHLGTQLQVVQERYAQLLQTLDGVSSAEIMDLSDLQMVEQAEAPDAGRPDSPKGMVALVLGTFLGVFFGISLALLVDYLDDSIRSGEDLKEIGLSFLGSILRGRRGDGLLISQRDPRDPFCEAYRGLRNRIKFERLDAPPQALMITSPYAADGRSLTAANLAISLASEEKKVLLVDADLRHPSLHDLFDKDNERGVTTVIQEGQALAETIQPTDMPGLDLLVSGPVPSDPGRLIESRRMQTLIRESCRIYDHVILDAPPLSVDHNDAVILARYADAPLMVMKAKGVSRRRLVDILFQTQKAGVQWLGAAINSRRRVAGRRVERWLRSPLIRKIAIFGR